MLNEGILLARATAGIRKRQQAVSWHGFLHCCPKGVGLRVFLDEGGRIAATEVIQDVSQFRMFWKDKGKSFPVIKLQTIFLVESVPRKRDAVLAMVDAKISEGTANGWDKKLIKKLKDAFHREAAFLAQLLDNETPDSEALTVLCQRAQKIDVEKFPLAMATLLKDEAQRSEIDVTEKPFSTLLLGKTKGGVYVQFEPKGNFPIPAFHERSLIELNRHLHEYDLQSGAICRDDSIDKLKDAFGGSLDGYTETYPTIKMPGKLGEVALFAKSADSRCFRRYGLVEAAAFPVGRESRQQIKDAFDWAFDSPECEGKIWRLLPPCGIGHPLLVSYVDQPENEITPDLGDFFVGLRKEDVSAISDKTYEAKIKDVLDTLKGIASRFPNAGVRVFIVTKIGKSRTQVELSQRIAIQTLKAAAETWQAGIQNIPITLLSEPQLTPFPEQVVDLLNTVWIMNCKVSKKVHGFKGGDGIRLLLSEGKDRIVGDALSMFVKNSYPFFVRWREEWQKNEGKNMKDFTKRQITRRKNEDASDDQRAWRLIRRGVPTLGLLLLKLHQTKDVYMSNTPYQIGQLMALVDELHHEYCERARRGLIASQLLGNAMMRIAYDNPQRAVKMLFLRLMPYLNWAKTSKEKPSAYCPIRDLGDKLRQASFNIPPSDGDRAQMLLGYLAKTYQPNQLSSEAIKSTNPRNNETETKTS